MRRREQREHVFKLMFMTEFNSEEEMTEQLSLYFEGLGELSEQDQEYMKKKYAHVKEHLEEIFSYNVTGEKTMMQTYRQE